MKIDPRHLPLEGLHMEGTRPPSFFELPPGDPAQAKSGLSYDLTVMRDEDELLITGTVSATFELQCGRCTEPFLHRVELSPYGTELPIENDSPIDLTEPVREDILLALPNHPRCEDGNVQPRTCPAEGRFDTEPSAVSEELPEETDKVVWKALDQLQNLKSN